MAEYGDSVMQKDVRQLKVLFKLRCVVNLLAIVAGIAVLTNPISSLWFSIGLQMLAYVFVVALCLSPIITAKKWLIHARQQLEATNADCDAGDALHRWIMEHPERDFSDPTAQRLLRRLIKAQKRFLKIHRFKNEQHLEFLRTQLRQF